MAVVNVNGISGINSITAQSNALDFYNSAGDTLSIGANLTGNVTGNATGLSGTPNITVNQINASGVITATSFSGSGANLTGIAATTDVRTNSLVVSGVSTVTDLRVGTAVTANSNGIQVGAGKSVRIFGSTSGFSDIIASSAAGASELLLPNTSGTLDRLNRAGNVLQVVSTSKTSSATEIAAISSTSFTTGGFSTNITPTSASSKIFLQFNGISYNTGGTQYRFFAFFKNSTNVSGNLVLLTGSDYTTTCLSFLDSPASTSALTYSVGIAGYAASGTHYLIQSGTLTIMEIAA